MQFVIVGTATSSKSNLDLLSNLYLEIRHMHMYIRV